jgi:hypothetical protein
MSWTGPPGPQGPAGPCYDEAHKCESNTEWHIASSATPPEQRSTMWLTASIEPAKYKRMQILWHQKNGSWSLDEKGGIPVQPPDWYSEFPCWPPPLSWVWEKVLGSPGPEGVNGPS